MSLLSFWTRAALQRRVPVIDERHWYVTEWRSKGRVYRVFVSDARAACQLRSSFAELEIVDWIAGQKETECITCHELRQSCMPPRYSVHVVKGRASGTPVHLSIPTSAAVTARAGLGKTFPPPTIGKKK